jgi:hypothetical protein
MILLASVALLSSFRLLLEAWGQYAIMADQPQSVPAFIARFDEFKKAVPKAGTIGYVTDEVRDPNTAIAEYYVTQYALAPLVVENTYTNQRFVVANFHKATPEADLAKRGLALVQDFGNGVELLANRRKVAPPPRK